MGGRKLSPGEKFFLVRVAAVDRTPPYVLHKRLPIPLPPTQSQLKKSTPYARSITPPTPPHLTEPILLTKTARSHHLKAMVTTNSQGGSFNILGSSKFNTIDGKNPATKKSTSAASSTAQQAKGKDEGSTHQSEADRLTACQKAHNALEARLRDEELSARSRGWS